jgi:NAD(P)-dependent dehydrogenase (short-subunit alcohol dehydrogenase family)
MDFNNKTVMVTGASGNLGRAAALAFHQRGANLVLVDRSLDHLARPSVMKASDACSSRQTCSTRRR